MSGILEFYDDMEDWRGDWNDCLWDQSLAIFAADTHLDNIPLPPADLLQCRLAISQLVGAGKDLITAIQLTTGQARGRYYYDLLTDGVILGGSFPDYELTAGKIMEAWIDANLTGRMMTVLTIDEMRREIWSEEFLSYRIRPAVR